ncbi:GDNF family receptor alpha-2 [Salmo salar]|uniref:GDNF family receptor alpha-2 n=2 Tax=Salmo TaxID=8028 RepID=A0A673WXN2_SALTR|nr:GDNF family receptor alpha-2 [Salmo salar]XP_029624871.1 GDNF family receptor alpha-2-like [Salmo trutta]|eukprot:XP_013983745.1 PREDICTED: GDNF family receptor alpha-2-like isoform X1 [Salmo salar]
MILLNVFSVLFLLGCVCVVCVCGHGWRESLECVRALELCNGDSQCSSSYRIMRQCLSGGAQDRQTMLASRECQGAIEVLQDSSLYNCRCKRGMKKELQCLQNYWSIHQGLTETGEDFYELSPYELHEFSEEFRHASIISDSSLSKANPCSEPGKPCNPCLDAAKACNLNETCKRQRSNYIAICNKPPQPSQANHEPCSRKRCHKALRQFFERVSWELSYPLLFCSCPDQACAERRRQTIVPACSHQEKHRPSCLELRRNCRSDALCRSRLADFHTTCQMTGHSINSCPHDNYHGCLMAYVGLIGSDVTPNYMDSSPSNSTISPWCSCRGTGNQEQECDAFLRDFTHNTCLKNSIQAFGYGSEGSVLPVTESLATPFPPIQPPLNSKPAPSLQANDVKPLDSACVFSTCANLKEGGQKCIPSNDFECEEALLAQGSVDSEGEEGRAQRSAAASGPLGVRGCVSVYVTMLGLLLQAL